MGRELLDPSVWREALERYALATSLGVALTDASGRLLGQCVHPRPLWNLLHAGPAASGGCPFAVAPLKPCTCVADALAGGGVVVAHDRTGLVHFTIPLVLAGHPLGTLIAGQVFDQYPDQLVLEHVATHLGVSAREAWQMARLEHPVRQATLRVYADLLATLAGHLLHGRYHAITEAARLAELTRLSDQLRRQAEELVEANRRKDEFLAMLAHELRNPLAPVRNAVQVIQYHAREDPNLRHAGEVVERQVRHLTRLVDDLLDVSRFGSGKITLRTEPIDLVAVVAAAVEAARPAVEGNHQGLSVELPTERLRVQGDSVRLAQVLGNLLNNAAKYTPVGGRIWLTASREGDEAVLRVRDTGVGIAAEMLPRVFDLFAQADRSLAHSQGGLGIGLTLAKSLVELHNGSVQAFSGGPDQGSEFVVRLPLLPDAPRPADFEAATNGQKVTSLPRRVLVVDDNEDAAETLADLLELTGHKVQSAHDGPAALEAARKCRPEVVFLDIGLPGMDGYEVSRRLRDMAGEKMVLVALTGYGQEDDRRRARDAGFDHHLVKPADPTAIQEVLASAGAKAWSGNV